MEITTTTPTQNGYQPTRPGSIEDIAQTCYARFLEFISTFEPDDAVYEDRTELSLAWAMRDVVEFYRLNDAKLHEVSQRLEQFQHEEDWGETVRLIEREEAPHGRCLPRPTPEFLDEFRRVIRPSLFVSAAEQAAHKTEPIDYVAPPYFAKRCVTNVAGRIKGGKTTFLLAMCAAKVAGGNFLGQILTPGAVVYLTEERESTFRTALRRAGIDEDPDFHILYRSKVADKTWVEIVDLATRYCGAEGAEILVVDTVPRWARVPDDEEQSGGAARAAMEPLEKAAAAGLSVVCGFHARKSGGSVADALAGSREWNGSADVIMLLSKPDANQPTVRELEAEGRLDVPDRILVDRLEDGTYAMLGSQANAKASQLWKWVYSFVADHPGCLLADIVTTSKEEATGYGRTIIADALTKMDGVARSGTGRKGDPYTYRLAGLTAADEA